MTGTPFLKDNSLTQPTSTFPRLVGDIGGTNVRFAWQARAGSALTDHLRYRTADHASLQAVVERYLVDRGGCRPTWCAIGIANPVLGDEVQMTNHHWRFSIAALKKELGLERLLVINDFTALALALPHLGLRDLHKVGRGEAVVDAPVALIGPGTGLGVSGVLKTPGGHCAIPIQGEGGHVTLAPTNELETAVVRSLQLKFGHASAERALSGSGLENLYEAICDVEGSSFQFMTADQISAKGLQGGNDRCERTLELFCSFLGNVAGNLTLTLGARGGTFIGGGIVPRLGHFFEASNFRRRFEDKGRFRQYLEGVPAYVVVAEAPALVGAARALDSLAI